jgi:hypothetical protein
MKRLSLGWYNVTLHVLLAVFAISVLLLASENRRLKAAPSADLLAAGDPLPTVLVNELDGSVSELSFDSQGQETIAMFFTTTCGICQDNLGNWLDLYERLGADHNFVAIGLDHPEAVRTYAARKSLPFRVVTPVNRPEFVEQFKVRGVPQTVLASADGRIRKIQRGRLRDW